MLKLSDSTLRQKLHSISTGGTIDSYWAPEKDTAITRRTSIIPEALRAATHRQITSETPFLKDSREITGNDKRMVAAMAMEGPENRIIITSGTYLMPEVASRIAKHPMAEHLISFNKKIAITGSIIPIDGFAGSDGSFNLGMATALLDCEEAPTIFITMNGRVFKPNEVEKDLTSATFSATSGKDILGYNTINIIPAGGSIDFELDGLDGLVPSRHSFIANYLRSNVRLDRKITGSHPILKDSRNLTEADIDLIINIIRKSTSDINLITTGTYKAQAIAKKIEAGISGLKESRPKVILTGSRFPLKSTGITDASFNLGYALGIAGFMDRGVITTFQGQIFNDGDSVVRTIYTAEEQKRLKEANLI